MTSYLFLYFILSSLIATCCSFLPHPLFWPFSSCLHCTPFHSAISSLGLTFRLCGPTSSFGLLPPMGRWLASKVLQQMPVISMPLQLIAGLQIQQMVNGSDAPGVFAQSVSLFLKGRLMLPGVAAVVGYGPTHLLSLSKVPQAIAPPVLRRLTLIYISVN